MKRELINLKNMQIKSWQIVLAGIILEVLILTTDTSPFPSVGGGDIPRGIGLLLVVSVIIFIGSVIASLLYFKKTSNVMAFLCIAGGIILLIGVKGNLIILVKLLFNKYFIFFNSIYIAGIYHFRKNIAGSPNQFFR